MLHEFGWNYLPFDDIKKWKNASEIKNEIAITIKYVSFSELEYPRYFVTEPRLENASGFKEHIFHDHIGFGTQVLFYMERLE